MKIHTTVMETAIKHNRNHLFLVISVSTFCFGSFIYLCFCSTNLYLYDWFNIDAKAEWLQDIRTYFSKVSTPEWFRYNLPDALWLLSYLSIMEWIWTEKEHRFKYIFIYSMAALAFGAEFLQYYNIIPGTGDWWDIISYLLTLLTFYLIKSI